MRASRLLNGALPWLMSSHAPPTGWLVMDVMPMPVSALICWPVVTAAAWAWPVDRLDWLCDESVTSSKVRLFRYGWFAAYSE